MSNNPSFSKVPLQGVQAASIDNLQKYIVELTNYINENHRKYNHNMQTLKDFYEEQIQNIKQEKDERQDQIVLLQNQIASYRDQVTTRKRRVQELEEELEQAKEEEKIGRDKLMHERRQIDKVYQDMAQLREEWQNKLDQKVQMINTLKENNQNLANQISSKDNQIYNLNDKVYELEDKVTQRYSLPQKITDLEKDYSKVQNNLELTKAKCRQLEKKLDYNQEELERLRKENETLRIVKGKFTAEKNLQVEQAVKQSKENLQYRISQLEKEQQSYVYQLTESEGRTKIMKRQLEQFQNELRRERERSEGLIKEMKIQGEGKDAYITQFAELKAQYQGVIHRLEDTLVEYQQKNWQMEQQNRDLNGQLEDLKELLEEVKAINSMQPAKKQYRRLAELQLLARKKQSSSPSKEKEGNTRQVNSEFNSDWQKLMSDIEKIQV